MVVGLVFCVWLGGGRWVAQLRFEVENRLWISSKVLGR